MTQGSRPIITSVGNIRHVKGFDVLIRAAALVREHYPEALFLIAGRSTDGEAECLRGLEELRDKLTLNNEVRFVGPVDDVPGFLRQSTVFCLLSRSEGFSNALLEAMACGLPSVVANVGGNAEAIEDGISGFVVNSEDHSAAAERICRILADAALAKRLGNNAQESVRTRFGPTEVISQLVSVYDSLLRNHNNGKRARL